MKKLGLIFLIVTCMLDAFASDKAPKIQMAILLDTSSSMDGLINQARTRLWHIVNEAAVTRKGGQVPDLEVALFEYGKSSLPASSGYIREIVPLTHDLDLISEALFALKTNGGDEYCGQVIQDALTHLNWSSNKDDYKSIFIAGNEEFNQGSVAFRPVCERALEKGIVVNTIYCGKRSQGILELWREGAKAGGGAYTVIDQNQTLADINAPQDDRILELNKKYNAYYIPMDAAGMANNRRNVEQDSLVVSSSKEAAVQRSFFKAAKKKGKKDRDLIAAVAEDEAAIEEVEEAYLPEEMKGMSKEERVAYVKEKAEERKAIEDELKKLKKEREAFVTQKMKEDKRGLDAQMNQVLVDQLKAKKFVKKQ